MEEIDEVAVNKHTRGTIVLMISIGNRAHLTDITYPRLSAWAETHGYAAQLISEPLDNSFAPPHFNKLIAHRAAPGYSRYIIIDDDLILKAGAPAMQSVPPGMIGLAPDAIQFNTAARHVTWTGNTGFIVAGKDALHLLETAYIEGEYPYNCWDGSGNGIWGPFDQGTLNHVIFRQNSAYQLDWRWNYQAVIDHYANHGEGWERWRSSRRYRLSYYFSLLNPFSPARGRIRACYGLHMTMGSYPRFFGWLHN